MRKAGTNICLWPTSSGSGSTWRLSSTPICSWPLLLMSPSTLSPWRFRFRGASFLTIAGGFLFGWLLAGVATVIAATLGATVVFLAARSSLGTALKARAGPFLARLSSGFRENAMSYLLFLRLTPIFPFWLVNIAPAIFHVPVGTYVFSTLVGIIPGTFAFAFIGSGLDSVIAAQEAANPGCAAAGSCEVDIGAFVTPELLAAFFVLGFASLIPVVLKRLRKKRAST